MSLFFDLAMHDSKLKVGFIGAGGNTLKMHIPGFAKIPGVELSVVANRTIESAERVAKKDGIKRVASDWREIVADPSIDAVCIGTWPYLHAEATIAALKNGKHVLCEARMSCDLAQAKEMKKVADAHPELVAQLVPAPHSLDFDGTIRETIQQGVIGNLLEVRVVHTGGQSADPDSPMSWRQDKVLSGKNILTMGIMHEAVQRWVEDEPAWLLADAAIFQSERYYAGENEPQCVQVPDSLTILGRFQKSRARMIYHFSGVESGRPRMEFRLNGSKGALRLDPSKAMLVVAEAGSTEEKKITLSRSDSRGWQVEADFINSIREGHPVKLTSFEQGVRYMTFTEMVSDSLAGESARVEWPKG